MQPLVRERMLLAGVLVFGFVCLLLLYAVTHELGHGLVGLASGQILTEFDVSFWDLSAHVSLSGGIPSVRRLLQIGAGPGLPLLFWLIFQLAAPRRASAGLTLIKLMAALMALSPLLAWIVIPILALWGRAPTGDDATSFLEVSHMPPLLLSVLALTFFGGSWLLFFRTTPDLLGVWRALRQPASAELLAGARPLVLGLSGLAALAIAVSAGATALAAGNAPGMPTPPPGSTQVAAVDLRAGPYQATAVAEFTVSRPGGGSVFIVYREVDTAYLEFQIQGPGGFRALLHRAEGYRARAASSDWRETLAPGTYRLLLTANQSPGTATVYVSTP